MIEVEWDDLRQTNSPCGIFTRFARYFQFNLDENSLLCNKRELKFVDRRDKPLHDKKYSDSRFSITFLWVGGAAGVNGPVIFLENGTHLHPRIICNNLVTRYVFP